MSEVSWALLSGGTEIYRLCFYCLCCISVDVVFISRCLHAIFAIYICFYVLKGIAPLLGVYLRLTFIGLAREGQM